MLSIPSPIAEILDLARWAPSGDNTQPWRFEIVDDRHFIIHAFDTREHCVYDLDGHPSQIALGALLETLTIAAGNHGFRVEFRRRSGTPDTHADYIAYLIPDSSLASDPLFSCIRQRSVQRRPMRTTPLATLQKQSLQEAVGDAWSVYWFEGIASRWQLARLMFDNAKLRLTLPEAYLVHREIIAWRSQFSEDKVPDQALGLDKATLALMRWVMGSWRRVKFFNTWLAGHLTPRIELDLLPGLFCAAHFAIVSQKPLQSLDDYVAAGRAAQRFWLTATSLGLQLQPEMTPLIFGRYVREGIAFSQMHGAMKAAKNLNQRFAEMMQDVPLDQVAFLGRIGRGKVAISRSLRLPVERLLQTR